MSEAAANRARLVNQALVMLGLKPKFSVDTESDLGGIIDMVWPVVTGRCFGLHAWTMGREVMKLVRRSEPPAGGYEYAFDLPPATSGPQLRFFSDNDCRSIVRDFRVIGTVVACRVDALWAESRYPTDPGTWDPLFQAAFTVALASALAVPLQQDENTRDRYHEDAFGTPSEAGKGGLFGQLIAVDAARQPQESPTLWADPLTQARYLP